MHIRAIEPAVIEVLPAVAGLADVAADRDRWQKEATCEAERADSAIRRWLLLTAAGGFAGILAGGALFVWLSRKAGLCVAAASLAVFAVSVALYRWFEWFAWGGLVLILLAVGVLVWALYKNRIAFATVVQGGENLKATLAAGVTYTAEQVHALFKSAQAAAQAKQAPVYKMVKSVKGEE